MENDCDQDWSCPVDEESCETSDGDDDDPEMHKRNHIRYKLSTVGCLSTLMHHEMTEQSSLSWNH